MIINYTYDTSVTDLNTVGNAAYNPTLYTEFTGAVQAAIQYFDTTFINPITVNIAFGWGEVAGNAIAPGTTGQSSSFQFGVDYTTLYNALQATDTTSAVQIAAVASLPALDPTNGAQFAITTAEAAVLGLYGPAPDVGGSVGLDSSAQTIWSWNQSAVAPNTSDAVGAIEHEISEVLGRDANAGAGGVYNTLDLFRYTAADGGSTNPPGAAAGARDEPFVAGYNANVASFFSYNGATITLPFETPADVAAGADVADWAPSVANNSFADGGPDGTDPVTTTDLQEMQVLGYEVACFLPGTQITTPGGEVAVERLVVGANVLTHSGQVRTITWIGHGKALTPPGRRNAATPVIIRKDALAPNVPNRDLRVTKGHSLYFNTILIPAEFLVNHRSILWDDQAREVDVYHIELDAHDILLANGAPAESYRDDGNRWLFRNSSTGWDQPPQPPCAPVLTGGPAVDAIWQCLLDRSGSRPGMPLTNDPDLHLLVDQRRVASRHRANGRYVFDLPRSPKSIRIISRSSAQDELGLARDPRMLGVAIKRLVVWQGQRATAMEAEDEQLQNGFHAYEPECGYRWTNGDAELPERLLSGLTGPCTLDIYVAATAQYPLFQDDVSAAA